MLWVMLWLLTIAGAAWIALSWLPAGCDGHMPLPYLIALAPFMWMPMLLIAVVGGVMGHWWLAGAALLVAVASQLRRMRYWRNRFRPASQRSSATASFNVMTLNCRYGQADAQAIVDAVLTRNITVLALQELSDGLVRDLDERGLDVLLPYRQLGEKRKSDNGGYNGVWIRVEPKSSRRASCAIPAADVPSITLPVRSTQDITFASAHTKSPMRGCRAWSDGIIGLGALAQHDSNDVAVVLGDLNADIDHPSLRKLLDAGFGDANLSIARGPRHTFPRWLRWPRIVLDHILATSGARFTAVESFEVAGTDHLALTATIALD